MKFSFSQLSMLKGLQRIIGAVPSKMPMPSLGNIHLSLEGKTLSLTATDLEVTVTSRVELIESDGTGSVLIQAKRFQELVRELPDVPLEIEIQEPLKIFLKGEGVGVYTLPGGDPVEFPELPQVDAKLTFNMPAENLKRMVSKTVFAVSRDEMRPILTGLLLQMRPGEIRMAATDGHRLSRILRKDIEYTGEPRDVVIPMKAFSLLMRNLEDGDTPEIGIAETRSSFSTEEQRVITRLIDGQYPKYESVIPESNPNRMTVRTDDFMSAVRRVAIFASQLSRQVKVALDKTSMRLESEDPELGGRAEEEVSVEYVGEPVEIAYNAVYLMDVLKQVDTEEVVFELATSNDAAVIRSAEQQDNEDFLMLLMPIRLR